MLIWWIVLLGLVSAGQQVAFSNVCPRYDDYSKRIHQPLSRGRAGLPFQRPKIPCRSFVSDTIEAAIDTFKTKLKDKDVARLFENCLPNTLDTTIRWHNPELPQTFVITGDINAMWIRDSCFQLQPYLRYMSDRKLQVLVNGAVQTQAKYITQFPYCNAFQPPQESKLRPSRNNQHDDVFPPYDPDVVFECKYEIDSLSSFLRLSRQYYEQTKDNLLFTNDWIYGVQKVSCSRTSRMNWKLRRPRFCESCKSSLDPHMIRSAISGALPNTDSSATRTWRRRRWLSGALAIQ